MPNKHQTPVERIGIVVIPDTRLQQNAINLSMSMKGSLYNLAEAGTLPHISLMHLHLNVCSEEEAINIAIRSMDQVECCTKSMVAGKTSKVEVERNKWIFWKMEDSSKLQEMHEAVLGSLPTHRVNGFLSEYKNTGKNYRAHVTLGRYTDGLKIPDAPQVEWTLADLAVVRLGKHGEILDVVQKRNLYDKQVRELLGSFWVMDMCHSVLPRESKKAYRKHDGRTPYGVHPALCALTILHETSLPEAERLIGANVLTWHDILEDTSAHAPEKFPEFVKQHIADMSFASSAEEMEKVWSRSSFVKMLKLYDKWSNLYDGSMKPESRKVYEDYALRLSNEVKKTYPNLKIHNMIRAVVQGHNGFSKDAVPPGTFF